jgi:hypothetical protein
LVKGSLIDLQLQWLIITGTITDEHILNLRIPT